MSQAIPPNGHLLITGGTGFIGTALCRRLADAGYRLTVLTRDPDRAWRLVPQETVLVDCLTALKEGAAIDGIINLAGAPLADRRWNVARKRSFHESRVELTRQLFELFSRGGFPAPGVLVSGSAIGFYGPHDDEILTEDGDQVESFSSSLCRAWEAAAVQFQELGTRVCLSRTGVVLGHGGALGAMLPPFRLGLGGPLGSGRQWLSWIHLDDMVRALEFALVEESVTGPFNATAPAPVTNAEFSRTLAGVLVRPCVLRVPAFAMKLRYGEMAEELLLSGQRVIPAKLENAGFKFMYPDLRQALTDIVG